MPSYTDLFGNTTINPSQLSYISYSISANLELVWPMEAPPDANVAADKIDINATAGSLGVTLPPADQASVGQDILFRNVGSHTFFVYDQDGIQIAQVNSGEAWFVVLTDNSTDQGHWYAIEFGVGTSSATAATLAGAGLRANLTVLDQNLITNTLLANYTITASDRATVLQSNGGALVWTFTSAVTLGNGWFVYIINTGSGSIVLTPAGGQTIDDAATKTIAPTESLIVFSDGSNLHTLGYGRSLVTTVTGAAINIAGTGTLSLTSPQIAAQIQDWSGALTGDRILDYGGGNGYWFVRNNSTGAHTVTARTNNLDAGVVIAQGAFSIIRSNGTNMAIAFTATSGTVTSVATTADLVGGPITTTGTLGLSNTGVAAATYGTASAVPVVAIDVHGRATSAANTTIAITGSQVTDLNTIIAAALAAYLPTGSVQAFLGTSAPAGWVLGAGTIGNAGSGANNRANADTANLFAQVWNSFSNTLAPVSGGRGANAAADFAALKTITLPDMRGRVIAGLDNMVIGAAGRLTSVTMTPDGNTAGASGGAETQALTGANLAAHTHDLSNHIHDLTHTHTLSQLNGADIGVGATGPGGGGPVNGWSFQAGVQTTDPPAPSATGGPVSNVSGVAGSGTAFDKTQPTMVLPYIVRL